MIDKCPRCGKLHDLVEPPLPDVYYDPTPDDDNLAPPHIPVRPRRAGDDLPDYHEMQSRFALALHWIVCAIVAVSATRVSIGFGAVVGFALWVGRRVLTEAIARDRAEWQ